MKGQFSGERLATYLAERIPLTEAMQVSVDSWDGRALTVSAPLAANCNDKATAFGGSLYSLALLCGWGLLMQRLWDMNLRADVVIHKAEATYRAPVNERLVAQCRQDDDQEWQAFIASLRRRGRARLGLTARVNSEGQSAFELRAQYVATLR